jgi:hypothetical protein
MIGNASIRINAILINGIRIEIKKFLGNFDNRDLYDCTYYDTKTGIINKTVAYINPSGLFEIPSETPQWIKEKYNL